MLTYKRGKRKVIADYKFNDIYKFYKKNYDGRHLLSKQEVRALYKEMFPEIVKLIVLDNLQYRMPANLGYLRVKKKRVEPTLDNNGNLDTRTLSIDWKATKKLWQKLYPDKTADEISLIDNKPVIRELNEHTDGYRFTWFWEKLTSSLPNQSAYYLELTRDNDQILSKAGRINNLNFFG